LFEEERRPDGRGRPWRDARVVTVRSVIHGSLLKQRQGQPAVRGGGHPEVAHRRALARSSRTCWRLEEYSQMIFPMDRERRLGESIQDLSGRSGHRVRHDLCNHRQSPPAQRRGSKKGDSNEAIGRSRGGLTTKIHIIVDAQGNPLAVSLTGGHVHDLT
jgi:hypothetical protein